MRVTEEREWRARYKLDGNILVSRQFAAVLCAYRACSADVQRTIDSMALIVNDPDADADEREAAVRHRGGAVPVSNQRSAWG